MSSFTEDLSRSGMGEAYFFWELLDRFIIDFLVDGAYFFYIDFPILVARLGLLL